MDTQVDGRSIVECARRMVEIARRGLSLRGEAGPERRSTPLDQRIDERVSPAERLLQVYRSGGAEAVLRCARL